VAEEAHELMRLSRELILRDPRLYIAYMLFMEAFTVFEGPGFMAAVQAGCGVPRDRLSVVGNHVVADVGHVEEDIAALAAMTPDAAMQATVLEAVRTTARYADRFLASFAPRCAS
jgi:hypothetical protein